MKTVKQLKEGSVTGMSQWKTNHMDSVNRDFENTAHDALHKMDFEHPEGSAFHVHAGRYPGGRYVIAKHEHYENGNSLEPGYKVVRTHDENGKANDIRGVNVIAHTHHMRPHEVQAFMDATGPRGI